MRNVHLHWAVHVATAFFYALDFRLAVAVVQGCMMNSNKRPHRTWLVDRPKDLGNAEGWYSESGWSGEHFIRFQESAMSLSEPKQ